MKHNLSLLCILLSCFLFSAFKCVKKAPLQIDPNQTPAGFLTQQSQTNTTQNPTEHSATQSNSSCKTSADCVLVNKGCCGCGAGGESIAIPIAQKDSYNSQLKKHCLELEKTRGPMACPQSYRCEEFQAECRNSQCVTIKK